jgi:hypothetical protein
MTRTWVAHLGRLLTAAMQERWPGAKVHTLEPPEDEPGAGWTRSEVVPGSTGHFRATMERLYIRYHRDGWIASSGDRLRLGRNTHTDDKRGTWTVTLHREDELPCFAGIEAYEQYNGNTLVEFKDGYEPGSRWRASPIGPLFVRFSDIVVGEAQPIGAVMENEQEMPRSESAPAQQGIASEPSSVVSLQDLLPKKPETREKYKRAYSIIVKLREEYRELYENEETDKPAPNMDDYREALAFRMDWKPSGTLVRKIRKLGDGGLLEGLD